MGKATVSEEKPAEPAPKKKAGRPKKVPEKAATGSSQSTDDGVEAPVPKQESPSKSRNRRRRRRTSSGKLKPSTDNSDLAQPQADQSNRAQAQAASPKKSPAKRRRAAAKSRLGA